MAEKNSKNSGNQRTQIESEGESSPVVIAGVIAGVLSLSAGVLYLIKSTPNGDAHSLKRSTTTPVAPVHPGITGESPSSLIQRKKPSNPRSVDFYDDGEGNVYLTF